MVKYVVQPKVIYRSFTIDNIMVEFSEMITRLVRDVAGEEGVSLLNILEDRENVSEFDLAEQLSLNVNKVRNLLYRLYSYNLVFSSRKKDSQKGWYIYYWTFNFKHAKDLLVILKERRRKELREQLEKETKTTFFVCKNKCSRLPLEEAMEYKFKCQECEARMVQEDRAIKVQEIHKELNKLDEELEELKKPVIIMAKKEVKSTKKVKKEEIKEEPKVEKPKEKKKPKKVFKKAVRKKKVKSVKKKPKKIKWAVKRKKVVKKPRPKVKKPKPKQVKKPVKRSLFRKIKRRLKHTK